LDYSTQPQPLYERRRIELKIKKIKKIKKRIELAYLADLTPAQGGVTLD
jgi:hypothetical protein